MPDDKLSIDLPKGTYYNATDAATFLGVTSGRIRQMIHNGKLPAFKVSQRTHLIRAKDLRQHTEPKKTGRPRNGC